MKFHKHKKVVQQMAGVYLCTNIFEVIGCLTQLCPFFANMLYVVTRDFYQSQIFSDISRFVGKYSWNPSDSRLQDNTEVAV